MNTIKKLMPKTITAVLILLLIFSIIREILAKASHPVVAEGNINTPEKAKRVIELGCYCVVVGSIITRPQIITKGFASALVNSEKCVERDFAVL